MNEIDLITRYLESRGSQVDCIRYYTSKCDFVDDGDNEYVGVDNGETPGTCFFFGNVTIHYGLGGAVVLTNKNKLYMSFYEYWKGETLSQGTQDQCAIGCGLNLLGDGTYLGIKRLYGLSCNRVSFGIMNIGAAVAYATVYLNGYMFRMKA